MKETGLVPYARNGKEGLYMKGLLIKDMKLLATQKRFLGTLIFLMLFIYITAGAGNMMVGGYMMVMCTMLSLTTVSYDEADNGYAFLMTLPVMRKTYVREKYLLGVLANGAGVILCGAYMAVSALFQREPIDFVTALAVTAVMLLMSLFFLAVKLPLQLKFGNEKGRIVNMAVLVVFFAFIGLLAGIAQNLQLKMALAGFIHNFGSLLAITGVIIYPVLLCLSYFLSVRIMEKKEF